MIFFNYCDKYLRQISNNIDKREKRFLSLNINTFLYRP